MRRRSCSACGGGDLEPFLDLGDSPIADAYTSTPDEVARRYPLEVAVCAGCRLVQLLEVVDHEVLFGTGYSFYSSASAPLSAYHAEYAAQVLHRHPGLALRGVVEVGCNDGDLLRHFAAVGCPVLGVDPAAGPAGVAQGRGLPVQVDPFTVVLARRIVAERGPAGLVIANHVLAHVADVADMLAGIGVVLAGDGVAMVEVQYLPDLLVNNAFDLVYHEHRNFFSLSSLSRAAALRGLKVVDVELTARQGGSLRVTLIKDTGHLRASPAVADIQVSERWLHDPCAFAGMQGRVERIRVRLLDLIAREVEGTFGGYGAPAKATTLLNFCGLNQGDLTHVVDSTPAKQGRHIPGTGIPIVAPGAVEPAASYLLLAHNYAPQIIAGNPGRRWIVPIPVPEVRVCGS